MPKKHLLVSDDLSAINDPGNSKFVVLGEVLHEQYRRIESMDDSPAFGVWEMEVDCDLDKAHDRIREKNPPVEYSHVFRVVSNDEHVSRVGRWASFSLPDILNGADRPIWMSIDTMPDDPIRHIRTANTA